MKRWRSWTSLTAALLLGGCSTSDPSSKSSDESDPDSGLERLPEAEEDQSSNDDNNADTGSGPDTDPPATHWCEAVQGGAAGTRPLAQDFARAHVGQRLFGPTADWLGADTILVALLDGDTFPSDTLLEDYADQFADVCAAEALTVESGPATVTLHDTVAVIEPGTGAIALGGAASIVLDLRAPTTDEAVHQTLAALIQGDVEFAQRTVRRFQGFPSQDSDWTHYEVRNRPQVQSITGTADAGRPIVVLTGRTLTPATATLVGGLRMHGTVALAGHDIFASVAESHWTGIADEGLVWRSSILRSDSSPWPDVIPADLGTTDLAEVLAAMDALSTPGPVTGEMTRAEFANYDRSAGVPDDTLTRGAMRAALLVAYGTFDLFYTYFDLVGRDIDDALLAGLDEIDSHTRGDRSAMAHTMGRFMHALHDGHGFYFDDGREDWPDGWMALQIQEIDGRPVVRDSRVAGLEPGDTIVEVNGTAIEDWYAEAMGRYSAASDGYRFVLATDELTEVWRGTEWVVQAPDGVERGFAPVASTWEDIDAVPWGGTDRPNGWLADLGAPSVYYVNMAGDVTPDESNVVRELAAAESTTGVVLDMRDYPYLDIYGFAGTFNPTGYAAPTFGHPTWVGPDHFSIEEEVWTFSSARHVVDEPVVLLVSHKSVSAAECFAQMVMDLDNVTVVGQQSASTNGTITNAWLPGRWQVTFTGMQLTNPDGTDFHGIGVVPDVEVLPTADDFAAGIDPELLEALRVLGY